MNTNQTTNQSQEEMGHSKDYKPEQLALIKSLGLTIDEVERVKVDLETDATFEALVLAAKFLELQKSTDEFSREQEADGFTLSAEEHYQRAARYEACYWGICRQWPTPTTEAAFEDEDEALKIGTDWKNDSSLEKWFPFTAKEIASLRSRLSAAQKAIDELVWAHRISVDQHRCGWLVEGIKRVRALLSSDEKAKDG